MGSRSIQWSVILEPGDRRGGVSTGSTAQFQPTVPLVSLDVLLELCWSRELGRLQNGSRGNDLSLWFQVITPVLLIGFLLELGEGPYVLVLARVCDI